MSLSPDCAELPAHVEQACNDYKKGGISAIAIIDPSASITDFSDASQWTTAINANLVKIIGAIKGILPKASAIEGENALACGSEKQLDGFDRSLTWKDFNVNADNDAFYPALNQKRAYVGIFYCNENEVRIIAPPQLVNFVCTPAEAPEGNREKQMYGCEAKWFEPVDYYSITYPAPVGIFS